MPFLFFRVFIIVFVAFLGTASLFWEEKIEKSHPSKIDWQKTYQVHKKILNQLFDEHLFEVTKVKSEIVEMKSSTGYLKYNNLFKDLTALTEYLINNLEKEREWGIHPIFESTLSAEEWSIGVPMGYQSFLSPFGMEYRYKLWLNEVVSLDSYIKLSKNYDVLYFNHPPPSFSLLSIKEAIAAIRHGDATSEIEKELGENVVSKLRTAIKGAKNTYSDFRDFEKEQLEGKSTKSCLLKINQPCIFSGKQVLKITKQNIASNKKCFEPNDYLPALSNDTIFLKSSECEGVYQVRLGRPKHERIFDLNKKHYIGPFMRSSKNRRSQHPIDYLQSFFLEKDLSILARTPKNIPELIDSLEKIKYTDLVEEQLKAMDLDKKFAQQLDILHSDRLSNAEIPIFDFVKKLVRYSRSLGELRSIVFTPSWRSNPSISYQGVWIQFLAKFKGDNPPLLKDNFLLEERLAEVSQLLDKMNDFTICLYPGYEKLCPFEQAYEQITYFDSLLISIFTQIDASILIWQDPLISFHHHPFLFYNEEDFYNNSIEWKGIEL